MSNGLYILDGSGEKPVRCDDWQRWAEWFENFKLRRVDTTLLGGGRILVSTVFLGVDHGILSSAPVLWETMVFRVAGRKISGDSLDYDRCTGTREQAHAMHKMMCAQMKALLELELELQA